MEVLLHWKEFSEWWQLFWFEVKKDQFRNAAWILCVKEQQNWTLKSAGQADLSIDFIPFFFCLQMTP